MDPFKFQSALDYDSWEMCWMEKRMSDKERLSPHFWGIPIRLEESVLERSSRSTGRSRSWSLGHLSQPPLPRISWPIMPTCRKQVIDHFSRTSPTLFLQWLQWQNCIFLLGAPPLGFICRCIAMKTASTLMSMRKCETEIDSDLH